MSQRLRQHFLACLFSFPPSDQHGGRLSAGKELESLKEKGERAEELEILIQKLERDNESLQKRVASLGITCEKVGSCRFLEEILQN